MGIAWWVFLLAGILLGAVVAFISSKGKGNLSFGLFIVFFFASWAAFGWAIHTAGWLGGLAGWLRLTIPIVVGLVAAAAAFMIWMKVLASFEPPPKDEPMSDELAQSLRDKGVVPTSPFPLCDETGRLICKNCGVAFETATLNTAHDSFKNSKTIGAFLLNCTRCEKVSMFMAREIENARAQR